MRTHGLLVICVLGLLCISAKAQDDGGGVHSTPNNQVAGRVITAHGKAVPGAIVILRDVVTGQKMIAKADKQGRYFFARVCYGEYSLSASFNDKKSETQIISLKHREQLQKDLEIKNE
ncbi:MAG TPA: carboxypeptidase-like regulatory domain-containing protein [Candidatus Angelobacter sp.]|jgi:hypothetical protein|nr:carboxypeptidase-like regulatory domain-containing protein [Candidatus Angelobacter sp.]